MQTHRQSHCAHVPGYFLRWWMGVFLALALTTALRGQEVSIVHNFGDGSIANDGTAPNSSLVQGTDGNFYGTTSQGGFNNSGTIFKMTPQGAITILHQFGDGSITNDGASPMGELAFAVDGHIYGTTSAGGTKGAGTIYKITPQGGMMIVHNFDGSANGSVGGYTPEAGVIQAQDGNFYGTTFQGGGANNGGVVFRLTPDGTYDVLHTFGALSGDALSPEYGLAQDAQGNFYGTAASGGSGGHGTIYTIDSSGAYSILFNFPAPEYGFTLGTSYTPNGMGGYSPHSPLTVGADGNLYGKASGLFYGQGAIYRITPQGQISFLHYFGDGSIASDGAEYLTMPFGLSIGINISPPGKRLIWGSDGNIYGTNYAGGIGNNGVVFKITPSGTTTILHRFGDGTAEKDGVHPDSGLIEGNDGNFYGTTTGGGAGHGTAYQIAPALPAFTSPMQVVTGAGHVFTYQIVATQGPLTFSVGGLPSGWQFDAPTGVISGTPQATGNINITLTATNSSGSNSATLVVSVVSTPVITSLLNMVCSTSGISYQIQATENPTTFAATGLPQGLSVDARSGTIMGLPTQTGTFPVTISASNVDGTGTATLNLQVLAATPTGSQEYEPVHSFGDGTVNGEGSFPGAMFLGSDKTLYGVTAQGGTNGSGTIFNLSPAGNARVIANLGGANGVSPQGIIQTADGTLYGTAQSGGSANKGTLFKITSDGTFTLLHTFGDSTVANDGANPQCSLVQASDGNFYGTTQYGGSAGNGTVYKMTPSGTVTILHSFGDGSVANDGAQPVAALVQGGALWVSSTTTGFALVGTTLRGGAQDVGTLFAISYSGDVAILHGFGDPTVTNDGQLPHAAVFIDQNGLQLYGTTMTGGAIGKGTVFSYGMVLPYPGLNILHSFGDGTVPNDGENPISSLVAGYTGSFIPLNEPNLFGTTQNGGTAGQGTVFSCVVNKTTLAANAALSILHNFGDSAFPNDGTLPLGGVCVGPDGNLYGTTIGGGSGSGTAYALIVQQSETQLGLIASWTYTGTLPAGMTFDSTTGQLSGAPLSTDAAGAYTLMFQNGSAPSQAVTINLNQTFAGWAALHSVSPAPNATSGPDGISNLLKYLFDIDPNVPTCAADRTVLPTLGVTTPPGSTDTYLTLTFREYVGATGLTVTLQSSPDLQNWTDVTGSDLLSQQIGTDGSDPIVEMGVKMTGSAPQYLRLNVTQ